MVSISRVDAAYVASVSLLALAAVSSAASDLASRGQLTLDSKACVLAGSSFLFVVSLLVVCLEPRARGESLSHTDRIYMAGVSLLFTTAVLSTGTALESQSGNVAAASPTSSGLTTTTTMRLAIANIGLARALAHARVRESFVALRASIQRPGLAVTTFLTVAPEQGATITEEWLHSTRLAYGAVKATQAALWGLECNHRCSVPCNHTSHHAGDTDTYRWLTQFHKVRAAYQSIEAWERSASLRFDWILRVRSDLIYLEAFPALAGLLPSVAYVPRGVYSRNERHTLHNDHLFICPRALCAPFFTAVDAYDACKGRLLPPGKAPQELYVQKYAGHLQTLNLSYTPLTRGSGPPDCERLACSANSVASGCVATHLAKAYADCKALLTTWKEGAGGAGHRLRRRA